MRPVKKLSSGVLAWLSVKVQTLHTAQLMPLPFTVSCFSKIQIGFYRYASAVLAMGLCLCLSVCLSVSVCHKSEFY